MHASPNIGKHFCAIAINHSISGDGWQRRSNQREIAISAPVRFRPGTVLDDDNFFIFILLSRESDGGAMRKANPDSLRSCPCFRVLRLNFACDLFDLLLVKFLQVEIIPIEHLIQVEPLT